MGSWWAIKVGSHEAPIWGKNAVSDKLMLLFADDDRFHDARWVAAQAMLKGEKSDASAVDDSEESGRRLSRLMGYEASVATLRTRLDLQGFSSARVRTLCASFFDDELAWPGADEDRWLAPHPAYVDGAAVTEGIATRRGQRATTTAGRCSDPELQFLSDCWESLRESYDDPRFALAVCLLHARPDTKVVLDLTDLVLGQYLDAEDRPHVDARVRLADAVAASGPVIVIAEGESDARWLRRSIELAAPAALHLFKFLDFNEFSAPGGVDRVVSLTKGMAAAGVMNRVVAVLDNDTAGLGGLDQLRVLQLPDRVVAERLPDVAYASAYPALGPEGHYFANVNGRAASIEFMFGADVLRQEDGTLFPVRWHGFNEARGAYQGRLSTADKRTVARRIDDALGVARDRELPSEIADGCRRLASMLLEAASGLVHLPASEFSDLTSTWRMAEVGAPRQIS